MRKNYRFLVLLVVLASFFSFIPGYRVQAAVKGPLMWIDSPIHNAVITRDTNITGWALNESGVSKVNIYVDNIYIGQAEYGTERPDVNSFYPGYPAGNKSGYSFTLSVPALTSGSHSVIVEAVGNDGTSQKMTWPVVIQKTPIAAATSAVRIQAETWARNKKATETFISLAEKYWSLAEKRGNVDPAVAYAQAAKETGFGKFGGVIDETYNNPCGLKTTQGGADGDPAAHMRFKDWEEGITAHLDHLALYAGVEGYPRIDTPDPRHFPFIKGKGYSVEALGGAWAPSSTYGEEIVKMVKEMKASVLPKPGKVWIESPDSYYSSSKNFTVYGWALNWSGVKEVLIKIDNQPFGKAAVEQNRGDVNALYEGFPTGSSFYLEVDINKAPQGNRTLTVEVLGQDGSRTEQSIKIYVDKPIPRMWIETFTSDIKLAQGSNAVPVYGWALNHSGVKEVNILIDGEKRDKAFIQNNRSDVNDIYPGYPSAVSMLYYVDINNVPRGNHVLTVEAVGNDGSKTTQNINVSADKPDPMMWMEAPAKDSIVKSKTSASGWILSNSIISSIDVIVDGVKKGQGKAEGLRPDVNAAIKGYPAAKSFNAIVDLSSEKQGPHNITVEVKFSDGTKVSQSTKVVKSIIYAIDIGHNVVYDTGAVGIRKEDELTKEVGLKVIEKLTKSGYEVVNVLPKTATSVKDSLQQRVDKANTAKVDYFVSIHFNVYNGTAKGTEAYTLSEEGRKIAQKVVDNIAALGYTNRGVKSNDFFVLVNTNAPAILIECFFVDNAEDMRKYDAEDLADAIVRGIMK
jgi:N-acetylmuramoyl-L-alanine amidase